MLIHEQMLKSKTVRRALMVGCGLQLFQQVIGINAVMYYSGRIVSVLLNLNVEVLHLTSSFTMHGL